MIGAGGPPIPFPELCCETCAKGWETKFNCVITTTTTTTITAKPPPPGARMMTNQKELDHFNLLNNLRANGFSCPDGTVWPPNPVPLKWHCRLFEAAQWHSEDMATKNYFSHIGQAGSTKYTERAAERGTSVDVENMAAGNSGAAAVLAQWKGSNGHCIEMGRPVWKSFAVGYAYNESSDFKHYWTQMFSRYDTGLDETGCVHSNLLQTNVAGSPIEIPLEDVEEADNEIKNHDETKFPTEKPAVRGD